MSHDTSFSTQARVLMCKNCGAPIEAANANGLRECTFCNVQNQILGRNQTLVAPARAVPISEAERNQRLRAQVDKPWVLPESIRPFYEGGAVPSWKMNEALAVWKQTRIEVETAHSPEAAERLIFLCVILAQTYGIQNDAARQRAIYESTLDLVTLPRHRQIALCGLARAALGKNDVESAEEWLRLCDPASDDLESDSEYRHTRASIDMHCKNYERVLQNLGSTNDAIPVQLAMWDLCVLFRANALEKLGRFDEATALLREALARPKGLATMEMLLKVWGGFCPVSYPQALQSQTPARPQRNMVPFVMVPIMVLGALGTVGVLVATAVHNESTVSPPPTPTRPVPVIPTPEPPAVPVGDYAESPEVKRTIRTLSPGFRKCIDKALPANPRMSGTSIVVAQIDATGKVGFLTAAGSLPAEVNVCLQGVVAGVTFPAPPGGHGVVTIPVNATTK